MTENVEKNINMWIREAIRMARQGVMHGTHSMRVYALLYTEILLLTFCQLSYVEGVKCSDRKFHSIIFESKVEIITGAEHYKTMCPNRDGPPCPTLSSFLQTMWTHGGMLFWHMPRGVPDLLSNFSVDFALHIQSHCGI